ATRFIGSRCLSQLITTIVKARALKLQEATKIRPKIVENQAGSSDITQSTEANVIEIISRPSPGPLTICRRLRIFLSAVRSCSCESQFSSPASSDQNAKKIAARIKKNDPFRYFAFCWRATVVFINVWLVQG